MPLARQEEDFIALAEETLRQAPPPPEPAGLGDSEAVVTPASDIGQPLPPGADTGQPVTLDTSLTGGYKGGTAGGASVAGAGEQTADDPFGLKITEQAPPISYQADEGRQRNWRNWWNMAVGITAFLVAAAVCYFGIYYGFIKKKGPSGKAAVAAVEEYCRQVVSGDTSRLSDVSLPGTTFQAELTSSLQQYDRSGVMSLKDFEGETTQVSAGRATVVIKRLVLELLTSTGNKKTIEVVASGKPASLRTTLTVVNQNGKWLVSN